MSLKDKIFPESDDNKSYFNFTYIPPEPIIIHKPRESCGHALDRIERNRQLGYEFAYIEASKAAGGWLKLHDIDPYIREKAQGIYKDAVYREMRSVDHQCQLQWNDFRKEDSKSIFD